ncbi:hypothetical protein ACN28S_65270 [Cystobacter fuscus]
MRPHHDVLPAVSIGVQEQRIEDRILDLEGVLWTVRFGPRPTQTKPG